MSGMHRAKASPQLYAALKDSSDPLLTQLTMCSQGQLPSSEFCTPQSLNATIQATREVQRQQYTSRETKRDDVESVDLTQDESKEPVESKVPQPITQHPAPSTRHSITLYCLGR